MHIKKQWLALVALLALPALAFAQSEEIDDIDDFMQQVMSQRTSTWNTLYNYLFQQTDTYKVTDDLGYIPFEGMSFKYDWYVREGYLVRSPHSVDGVPVSEEKKNEAELKWIKNLKDGKDKNDDVGISRDDFFGQKIESQNCYFVRWDELDGHKVAVVEYYPDFEVTEEDLQKDLVEERVDDLAENSFYVVMYVLPQEKQIIKMELNNTGMNFLPGRAVLRVDHVDAYMTMKLLADGTWVPDTVFVSVGLMSAKGVIVVKVIREYSDYSQSAVQVKFKSAPKKGGRPW